MEGAVSVFVVADAMTAWAGAAFGSVVAISIAIVLIVALVRGWKPWL